MIVVNFENSVMWSEVYSEMYLLVQNTGPETLYCGEESEDLKGNETYMHISRLEFVPQIGNDNGCFVNQEDGIDFQIEQQPFSENGRVHEWTCSYDGGVLEVKPKKSRAALKSGELLRIQVSVKAKAALPGWGNMTYQLCDWKIFNQSLSEVEAARNKGRQGLTIQKFPVPHIKQFGTDTQEYAYQKNAVVRWEISGIEKISGCHLYIDGKEYTEVSKGSVELFMGDEKHTLELREQHGLTVQKNFWPSWFKLQKQDNPGDNPPQKECCVQLWWNIPEAEICTFEKESKPAQNYSMEYNWFKTKTESERKLELTYYDERKLLQTMEITYEPPKILEFYKKETDFISIEQLDTASPVLTGIYGGADPWEPPLPPEPPKEKLVLNCSCMEGICYYRVNQSDIGTITQEHQKTIQEIDVLQQETYQIEVWDIYGYKVTGSC